MRPHSISLTQRRNILIGLTIACVLLVNGAILGKVLFNRSHILSQLQLSERELQLPYNYGFRKEDSSRRVSLSWTTLNSEPVSLNSNTWGWSYSKQLVLNEAHFASFQFPTCEQKNPQRHKKAAWVLVEFNGKSYRDYVARAEQYYALVQAQQEPPLDSVLALKELQEQRQDATNLLESAKNTDSRLFVIDAAADKALLEVALQARPQTDDTRLLILPADIQASYLRCSTSDTEPTRITINNLGVESLYVAKDIAEDFPRGEDPAAAGKLNARIHFTAEISYGRLYEPWISSLRLGAPD